MAPLFAAVGRNVAYGLKAAISSPAESGYCSSPAVVMVVDDDAVREVTANILADLGYAVVEAGSSMFEGGDGRHHQSGGYSDLPTG